MQIEVVDAGVAFADRLVFSGLTATIRPGKITAIVGPSGSGKSTLLALMAGLLTATSGEIYYVHKGQRLQPDPSDVVWVPQGSNALPARSAIDNAMIGSLASGRGRAASMTLAKESLRRVGLASREMALARQLSGGELQRLSFARALCASRPFVFADEPSASLDAQNVRLLAELLHEVRGDSTVVVATHDEVLMAAADEIIQLRAPDA